MHLPAVRRPLLSVVVAGALFASPAFAAPAATPTEPRAKGDSSAEKLRKALEQVSDSVEIVDQPLELAISQIHEVTKINFVLDRLTIQQLGVDPATAAVNIKLHNVKWKTALRTMLGQYNLGYAIIGEAAVVTSEEMAMYRQMRQRVSVDLERTQLTSALKQLAKETATNLLVDTRVVKEAQVPVTLQLEDVPLETAVRLMAEMVGLKPVRVGNVLFVTTKTSAAELRADTDLMPQPQPGARGMEDVVVPGLPGGAVQLPALQPPPAAPAKPAAAPAEKPEAPPADKAKDPKQEQPPKDKP